MTIPTSYSHVATSYFFNDASAIWDQFVAANGGVAPTDDSKLGDFVAFIAAHYTGDVEQIKYALSPAEIQQRAILFSTFSLVLKMLKTLQSSVAVQAQLLTFYGQWQAAYSNLIAKAPVYTSHTIGLTDARGQPYVSNSWTLSDTASEINLSQLGLQYGGMTIQDVVDVASQDIYQGVNNLDVASAAPSTYNLEVSAPSITYTTGATFGGGLGTSPLTLKLHPYININHQQDGGLFVGIGFKIDSAVITNTSVPFAIAPLAFVEGYEADGLVVYPSNLHQDGNTFPMFNGVFTVLSNSSSGTPSTLQGIRDTLTNGLKSALASTIGADGSIGFQIGYSVNGNVTPRLEVSTAVYTNINNGSAFQIPWLGNTLSSTDTNATTAVAQRNAKVQQFIQNLQAYKQVASNSSQTAQSSLDTSKEAISQQSDLLNSIVQAMQTVLASIFK